MTGTFGLVGAASTAIYLALAMIIGRAGMASATASLLAYGAATTASYAGHRSLTFRSRRAHRETVPRFLLVTLAGLAISLAVPSLLTQRLELPLAVSALAVALLVPAISFAGHVLIVFRAPARA